MGFVESKESEIEALKNEIRRLDRINNDKM